MHVLHRHATLCFMTLNPVHRLQDLPWHEPGYAEQEPYGSTRAAWEAEVQRPFKAGLAAGRARLLQLLGSPGQGLMIRASKEDVLRLPPLLRKVP